MFSHHEAGILTIRQIKIIEEVKKLVGEMKSLYKCNFNRTNSRKANKTIENFKEKSLFIALFSEGLRGQQLEIKLPHFTVFHHTHCFAWVKSQAIPHKILNVVLIHL